MAQIRFTKVIARDTFGYTLLDFNFTEGINSIEGVNGASKTSIFLTLMQGLFNRNSKGTKIDEVNNNITGLPYEIEVYFEDASGNNYVIVNSRKTGTIEIYKNGKPKHVKRIPDNLKIIEDILGVDFNTFQDLIYQSPKSSINLLEKDSDVSRKAFINKILKLDELDSQLEKMKQRDKEIVGKNGKLDMLRNQLRVLEGSFDEEYVEVQEEVYLGCAEDGIKDLYGLRDNLKEDKQAREGQLKVLIERITYYESCKNNFDKIGILEATLKELKAPTKSYEDLVDDRAKLLEQLRLAQQKLALLNTTKEQVEYAQSLRDQVRLLMLPQDPEEIDRSIINTRADIAETEATYNSYGRELMNLKECLANETCPTCNSTMDKNALSYKIKRLLETKAKLHEDLLVLKGALEVDLILQERLLHKKKLEDKLLVVQSADTLEDVNSNIKSTCELISATISTVTDTEWHIIDCRKFYDINKELQELKLMSGDVLDIEESTDYKNDLQGAIGILEGQLEETEEQLKVSQSQLKKMQDFNAVQRTLRAVNAQKKIQNDKLKDTLVATKTEIGDLENKSDLLKIWIGVLGSKGFRVHKMQSFLQQLNTVMHKYSQMLCDGRIRCMFFLTEGEIDFTVVDANKTVAWSCWSEGEKARVKLSCLFAVLELLEVLGAVSFNVLALDEIFSALDGSGKEGLFNVLNYLKGFSKCVFTIAHTKLALDTEYDSVIQAFKLEDGTTIIVQ